MALEPITRQEKIIAGQDLTPTTRMEKFLKQYGGGSGGVTSWNDLTDKPFGDNADGTVYPMSGKYVEGMGYVDTTSKVVLPESQAVAQGEGEFLVSENVPTLTTGNTYAVKYNGVKYTCVAQELKGMVALGNIEQTSDGVPFVAGQRDGMLLVASFDGATSVTISIEEVTEEIHQIDERLLPSGGGNVVTAIFKSSDYDNFISGLAPATSIDPEYSCENMSFAEAVESILGGKALECYFKFVNDSQAVSMPFVPRFYIDSDIGRPRIKLTPVYAELWNGDKNELIWDNNGSKDSVV